MELYTQRNNMRIPVEKTEVISRAIYSLLLDCCQRYYINLIWKFPKKCPDGEAYYALDMERLLSELRFVISSLYLNEKGEIASPEKYENLINISGCMKPPQYNQYALLDFIEFIAQNCKDIVNKKFHDFFRHYDYFFSDTDTVFYDFQEEINHIFEITGLLYTLTNKKTIERVLDRSVISTDIVQQISQIPEQGTKELLEEALRLFRMPHPNDRQIAIEKLWDALERLKTYYLSPTADKKASVTQIVFDISNNQQEFIDLFNTEFKTLTDIGNDFRIRHHETNKTEITDPRHYDYFFNRCLSLIALAIQYLK